MIDTRFQKIQLSEERLTERMNENPTKNPKSKHPKNLDPKILKIRKRNQNPEKP
jgi:hypothetical protein